MMLIPTEGYFLTNLVRNRGRTRQIFSKKITSRMRKRLLLIQKKLVSIPKASDPKLPPVSITSWPPRYHSLPLVLISLLEQTILPSQIIVWLSKSDYFLLDQDIRELFEGDIIKFCLTDDYGPHKKWFPMISIFNSPFVVCDDDIYYPPTWYESLINSDDQRTCVAHRCHWIKSFYDPQKKTIAISAYSDWEKDVHKINKPSHNLFPIGCGGIIIHPQRISSKFRDWSLINHLCPKADDIWLKLAHLDAGIFCTKSNYSFPCIEYLDTQKDGLMRENVDMLQNDIQLEKSLKQFDIDLSILV